MAAVSLVTRIRLGRQIVSVLVAGVALGLGFGLALGCFAAARATASAYSRILSAADAPDATIAVNADAEAAEAEIARLDGVVGVRSYVGYLGRADGVPPIYTLALIAPTSDRFPVERPFLRAGRLPNPNAPDEAFVNATSADGAGLEVGDRVVFTFPRGGDAPPVRTPVTIAGIGTFPGEPVEDETSLLPIFIFTRAFHDAHRELAAYGATSIDTAPGVDARRDLGAAITELGYDFQSVRSLDTERLSDALRPTVIVLTAMGVLAFTATLVAAGQIVQRRRERWLVDNERLVMTGMTRGDVALVQFGMAAVVGLLAAAVAAVTMTAVSPIAPIGPLHDFDPGQGVSVDATVLAIGCAAILVSIGILALVFVPLPRRDHAAPRVRHRRLLPAAAGSMPAVGLSLAFRTDRGQGRVWRSVAATTLASVMFALTAVFVASAVLLTDSPHRYGFAGNIIAMNQYGDQPADALTSAFVDVDGVEAATAYTNAALVMNDRTVPALAATPLKGDLHPTLLQGRMARAPDEIVVGQDTLGHLGLKLGRPVAVELSSRQRDPASDVSGPLPMRVVGVVTFPSIQQVGSDSPRLGVGALLSYDSYLRLGGPQANTSEFTVARLRSADAARSVMERFPDGLTDTSLSTTAWFMKAAPAELVQLDVVMPYLRGALLVGFFVLLIVVTHGLWTSVRGNARDRAALRALGSTPRQLDVVTTVQATPYAMAALVGLPLGVAAGRWLYMRFAHSLAVVDDPSASPAWALGIVGAMVLALATAVAISVVLARRAPVARTEQ